ncbi:MAG: DUF342 domain-containing protein, partial [Spirochaetaceae bacterium]
MGKPVLHGSVNIRIDARAMTAVGEFSLSKDGEDITSASIAAQLEAEGVYTGYSQHSIDEKLSRLPDPLPETVEIILAEGEKPVSPKPESANFNDFPVPEQLKEHTEQVLKAAKPPIIFVERKEKVPVEKTVTKKGLFGSSKEKTVTSTQVIKTKDRVYVDPKVLGSGYIYAGDEAGKISPGEKGLEGIDLFGKAVPPKAPADPNFYLGDGLERRGNTLYATQDGVLRYGSNWAEVLAFVPHVWSISISPDKSTCLISFYPGEHETPIPTEDEILAIVKEAKYPVDYLIPGRDIKMVLERALAADRKVQNYPISTSRDADFNISVSEDQMKAYLQIHKGRGRGKPLSLKEVGAAIKAEKLVGLDYAKIKEDLLAFFVSRDLDLTGYLLCEGVPPEEGEDREIEYNVDFLSGKDFSAAIAQLQAEPEGLQQMESGEVFPADSIQEMAPVAHEQRVITLSPPEPGTPGKDVYGKNIPGLPGKPAMLVLHENLAEKGNVIIALEEGILDKGEIEGTTHLRVRPHKDAEVLVEISPDGMMAFMSIFDGLGSGKRISEDSVFAAINDAGVVRGIDQQVVAELIEYVRNGEEVQNEVFARGKAPTPEGDVKIEYAVALASGKGVRLRQDGTADFRNQDNITRVNEGDLIATMLPPTVSAEDGYEVSGKVLPAQKAQGNQLTIHESIRQEPRQDGTIRLYSTIEGEFTNSGGVLAVRSTHTVKGDVCMSTGNIRFPGTVQVTGNVLAG